MATAATVAVKLLLDAKNFIEKLGASEKKLTDFQKGLGKISKSMTKVGGVMTAALTVPITLGFKKIISAAGDLEQATNAVGIVFEDTSYLIEDFAETSAMSVGLAKSDFKTMALEIGALLQNMDYSMEDSADNSIMLTKRAADMAAVYNTDVSQALMAVESGIRGMSRPLLQFGVNLSQSAINAKALEMGLADVESEITSNIEAQASIALIMEQTDAIAGHFAAETETLAGAMLVFKASAKDAAAALGTHLLPYATDLVIWATEMVVKFGELDGGAQKTILWIAGITAALGPLLVVGGQALVLFNNLTIAFPALSAGLGGLSESIGPAAAAALHSPPHLHPQRWH